MMIDRIIIFILGIVTLRDIIAFSGIVPQDKKFSWIIYNNYDSYIIRRTLNEIGITKSDIKYITERKKNLKDRRGITLENLVVIISNYIIFSEDEVEFGSVTPIKTPFYINTVEASYEPVYLKWMCSLMNSLILDSFNHGEISRLPDFILTPKGGNTLFGRTYAERNNILFLTSKYSIKSSYVKFDPEDCEYNLRTNYEGAWKLIEKQDKNNSEKLYGVVIDCNTTTGDQIINMVRDFNALIEDLDLNIEPITQAYTLYRPIDNNKCNIDEKFKRNELKLDRYFDLKETDKELIIKEKETIKEFNIDAKKDRIKIKRILESILDNSESEDVNI